MVISRSSNGKTKVLLEHYRTLGTPTVNGVLDAGFKKEVNPWAGATVHSSEGEDGGSERYRESSRGKT